MQQRQPRLGDILDDYCPRERRLTNHVVVAMIGESVKQTRCTTCESDHEYKNAALPRQKKKSEHSALFSQVLANVSPRRSTSMASLPEDDEGAADEGPAPQVSMPSTPEPPVVHAAGPVDAFDALFDLPDDADGNAETPVEEGPAHRRLIRAQLPRHEGQAAVTRQAPDFTIRQPNPGRPKRFGARPARSASPFQGSRPGGGGGNGNGNGHGNNARSGGSGGSGGGGQRQGGGRPQSGGGSRPAGSSGSRPANRQGGGGRNRPK